MTLASERTGVGIHRHFTTAGVHPYDEVQWEIGRASCRERVLCVV